MASVHLVISVLIYCDSIGAAYSIRLCAAALARGRQLGKRSCKNVSRRVAVKGTESLCFAVRYRAGWTRLCHKYSQCLNSRAEFIEGVANFPFPFPPFSFPTAACHCLSATTATHAQSSACPGKSASTRPQTARPVQSAVFGPDAVAPGKMAMALGKFGAGHVGFVNDVNFEAATWDAVGVLLVALVGAAYSCLQLTTAGQRVKSSGVSGGKDAVGSQREAAACVLEAASWELQGRTLALMRTLMGASQDNCWVRKALHVATALPSLDNCWVLGARNAASCTDIPGSGRGRRGQ
eukprot:362607-Chlamydomonas_euryale.AAC.21